MTRKLPTFILSGLQNAGKTTLLNHLLQSTTPEKTAVITNNNRQLLLQHQPGCSCCNGPTDHVTQVQALANNPTYDHLFIETAPITDPATIAEALVFEQDTAEIFAMITVVDASTFLDILFPQQDNDEEGEAESLILSLEFADIIIVNKTDLVEKSTLENICKHIQTLNPSAQILPTTFGTAPNTILTQKTFDFDETTQRAGWLHTLENPPQRSPETPTNQFVYHARRPFHPQRLMDCIERGWPGVFRSKGSIWLATRETIVGDWSQTGPSCALEPAGHWLAAIPRHKWPDDPETIAWATQNWDPQVGDRRQEIAFLGTHIDPQTLAKTLDACLLTPQEMALSPTERLHLPDPFPQWELDTDHFH